MNTEPDARTKAAARLHHLLELQKETEKKFGGKDYNIFVFGSYLNTAYQEGISDIDIAIYTENFDTYKQLAYYLEEHFQSQNIPSDIFYIDLSMEAPIYCAPLKSKLQFTDYFPPKLQEFSIKCQKLLEKNKKKVEIVA